MTLWNIIRDFFVQYIFGGVSSSGTMYLDNVFGEAFYINAENEVFDHGIGNNLLVPTGLINDEVNKSLYLYFGDWLSTTATIITLCAICVFLFLFVRWLFRLTAGLLQARG